MPLPKKTKANVKVLYTDAERMEIADRLARANVAKVQLEEQKKTVDADLKARIEEQSEAIQRESRKLMSGYEYRDVECEITYDTPQPGWKTVARVDTGEIVRQAPMTEAELQAELPLAPALDESSAAEAEPVDAPALPAMHVVGSGRGSKQRNRRGGDDSVAATEDETQPAFPVN